jgi:hypothetical protein
MKKDQQNASQLWGIFFRRFAGTGYCLFFLTLLYACSPGLKELERQGYQVFPGSKIALRIPCKLVSDSLTNIAWSHNDTETITTYVGPKSAGTAFRFSADPACYMLTIIDYHEKVNENYEREWLDSYASYLDSINVSHRDTTIDGYESLLVDWQITTKEFIMVKETIVCKGLIRSSDSLDLLFMNYISGIRNYE